MKTFELTSLGIVFEERMEQLRRKEAENNRHIEQLNILRTAISKMELESGGRVLSDVLMDNVQGLYQDDGDNIVVGSDNFSLSFSPQRGTSTGSDHSYVKEEIDELNVHLNKLNAARSELEELQEIIRQNHNNNGGNFDVQTGGLRIDTEGSDTISERQHEHKEFEAHPRNGLLVMGQS